MHLFRQAAFLSVILLGAFAGTIAVAFPVELAAERYVFPRVREKTGIPILVRTISYSFPAGLAMTNVQVGTPDGAGRFPVDLARLDIQAGWRALMIEPDFEFKAALAGGTLAGRSNPGQIYLRADQIDLAELSFVQETDGRRFTGKAGFEGTLPVPFARPDGKGDLAVEVDGLRLDRIEFMGLRLPEIHVGDFRGKLVLENGQLRVENGRSSGGEAQIEASGRIYLAKPMKDSQLDLSLGIKLSEKTLEEMGESGKLLRMAQQSHGKLQLGVLGSMAKPDFQGR